MSATRLAFNPHQQLQIERDGQEPRLLRNPYTDDGYLYAGTVPDGHWMFVGGRILPQPDDDNPEPQPFASVDFVNLHDLYDCRRWEFNAEGSYTDQTAFDLSCRIAREATPYLINPEFLRLAHKHLNDYKIYTLLLHTAGRASAQSYLNGFVTTHPVVPAWQRRCKLVVIYNHNYARNCPAIHAHYRARFPDIDFVLPCVAPRHPNYHAYPFGSFQFHGLIYSYLQDPLTLKVNIVKDF